MSKVLKSSQIILDKEKFKVVSKRETTSSDSLLDTSNTSSEEDSISKVKNECQQLIDSATADAKTIINEAYEKAKHIMEQGRLQGYSEGKEQGFQEGKELAESIINEALNIKQEVLDSKKNMLQRLEEELIELTLFTIEKIINQKIEDDYEIVFNLIKSGLEKCAFTDNLVLRISPEDYDFAVSSKDKILALSENIQDIKIKQDKSLKKGSCVIDTLSGSIDSSISTQINYVKQIFQELLKSE